MKGVYSTLLLHLFIFVFVLEFASLVCFQRVLPFAARLYVRCTFAPVDHRIKAPDSDPCRWRTLGELCFTSFCLSVSIDASHILYKFALTRGFYASADG